MDALVEDFDIHISTPETFPLLNLPEELMLAILQSLPDLATLKVSQKLQGVKYFLS